MTCLYRWLLRRIDALAYAYLDWRFRSVKGLVGDFIVCPPGWTFDRVLVKSPIPGLCDPLDCLETVGIRLKPAKGG